MAAPDADFVAVGRNTSSKGSPIAITMVRYASDGTLRWRVDLARTLPQVARLVVDAAGSSYLAFNSVGDGQDIQVHKYDSAGTLRWARVVSTGPMAQDRATSLALSPDGADVVLTGNISGGATWITAAYDTTTGARRWLVTAAEGTAARDVVVDATRVYVTGLGNVGITGFLTVVAYDRATGVRRWRTDRKPADGASAAGLRIAIAPDGSLVATGQAARGFLDWYTVAFETTGAVRWAAVRDGGLNTDEVPAGVLVLPNGTVVVTGPGGPNLPGGYIPGVTAGYDRNGTLLWEAFSKLATVWVTSLPNGDVCATGGYDALITCWSVSGNQPPTAVMSATPTTGPSPLNVTFDGSGSTDPDGTVTSWAWSFGDGSSGTGAATTHLYSTPGTFTASLTVTDNGGASNTTTSPIVVTTPQPGREILVSSTTNGTVGGVSFADEDILSLDPATGAWSMYFDGSDVGLASADIDAAERLPDGRLLLSTGSPVVLSGVSYDDSDVIAFTPISTGPTTAGTFSRYLSGSTVGLTTTLENVDAIAVTPSGELILSTAGRLSGGGLVAEDEDLVRVTGTALSLYLDGSAIGLAGSAEDIWGASITADNRIGFSAEAGFSLSSGLTGGPASIGRCTPASAPPVTACSAAELVASTALTPFGSEVIDAVSLSG